MVTMQADETAKLQTLEDRARVREEIAQCLAEPLEGDMPASISANQEEESVLKKSSLSTLQDVLEASQLRQTADPQGAEQKEIIALNRLKALLPPMRAFMRKVRIEEGLLSQACIANGAQSDLNAWNKLLGAIACHADMLGSSIFYHVFS